MYRNVQQSSESQSEASSSAESDWSDINSIALQMGIHPKDLCVERFKVDRQKLENMIKSNKAFLRFFQRVVVKKNLFFTSKIFLQMRHLLMV